MGNKPQQAAPQPPPAPRSPQLPGLTIAELKSLLGDKEVLILQMTKHIDHLQTQIGLFAAELKAKQEEVDKLRGKKGKGKKPPAKAEAGDES